MGNKFKPGDLCDVIGGKYAGRECTVVEHGRILWPMNSKETYFGYVCEIHGLRSAHPNGAFSFRPEYLRLKRPPADYDGNSAGEWDLCPWQPKRERA